MTFMTPKHTFVCLHFNNGVLTAVTITITTEVTNLNYLYRETKLLNLLQRVFSGGFADCLPFHH